MLYRIRFPLLIAASVAVYWLIVPMFFQQQSLESLYSINDFHQDISKMYFDIGRLSQQRKDFNSAIKAYTRALETNPMFLECYEYLGTCLELCRKIDQAFQTYMKAISLDASFLEARMKKTYGPPPCELTSHFPMPAQKMWVGQSIKNKIILVYAERSLGDTIQLVRFLPLLVKQEAKILLLAQQPLLNFFKENFTNTAVTILDDRTPLHTLTFDYFSSLFRLPSILRITRHSIPAQHGYLKVNQEKVTLFKNQFFNNTNFKIGICWQGNPNNSYDKYRSMQLQNFYDLAQIPGIKVYSLQRIHGINQLKTMPKTINITSLNTAIHNLEDLAAAIENLDLIISVDTLLPHLSGALGKPTWVLLSCIADCRWLSYSEGNTSCWYASVKKFRQKTLGHWNDVLGSVTKELKKLVVKEN